jgi:hypothetical protein
LSFSTILILRSDDDSCGNQDPNNNSNNGNNNNDTSRNSRKQTMQHQLILVDNSAFSQSLHPLCPSELPRIPLVCPEGAHL